MIRLGLSLILFPLGLPWAAMAQASGMAHSQSSATEVAFCGDVKAFDLFAQSFLILRDDTIETVPFSRRTEFFREVADASDGKRRQAIEPTEVKTGDRLCIQLDPRGAVAEWILVLPARVVGSGGQGLRDWNTTCTSDCRMVELPFQDRVQAGRLLGTELAARKLAADAVVLALPRGGVPIGAEVARALKAELDIVVVRKLGVPWQPELAMGAIAGGTRVLDRSLIHEFRISDEDVGAVVARETLELERRERLYRGGRPAYNLRDRTVVLVDDGLATGSTMVAAARHVRGLRPRRLIVAVPVASSEACDRLREESDECICLAIPEPFCAVGEWYTDFTQVSDAEVQELLKPSRSRQLA